jgi:hypothetical protein
MPKYKLRIMVNISDPTVDEYVELTSSMLEYGGKYKLESLPYFDPDNEFVPELRTKIQDLTFLMRVGLRRSLRISERKKGNPKKRVNLKSL